MQKAGPESRAVPQSPVPVVLRPLGLGCGKNVEEIGNLGYRNSRVL